MDYQLLKSNCGCIEQKRDLNHGLTREQSFLYQNSCLICDMLAAFLLWPRSTHFDLRLNGPVGKLTLTVGDGDRPFSAIAKQANAMAGFQVAELERLHGWKEGNKN